MQVARRRVEAAERRSEDQTDAGPVETSTRVGLGERLRDHDRAEARRASRRRAQGPVEVRREIEGEAPGGAGGPSASVPSTSGAAVSASSSPRAENRGSPGDDHATRGLRGARVGRAEAGLPQREHRVHAAEAERARDHRTHTRLPPAVEHVYERADRVGLVEPHRRQDGLLLGRRCAENTASTAPAAPRVCPTCPFELETGMRSTSAPRAEPERRRLHRRRSAASRCRAALT